MFIDPDIQIPPNMPKMLQEDFRQLQEYYDADDWPNFDMYWEGVESSIKNFYGMGRLTCDRKKENFVKMNNILDKG